MKPKQYVNDQTARRNLYLFVIQKIFAKRVFIPLTAIYFTEVAGFTLRDIAIGAIIFAASQILAEVPTGIFADKVARVTSIRMAGLLNIISTLLYALMPNHTGIYSALALEAVGYCFLSGAGDALMHDTLVWQKRPHEFTRISSKTQSISLIANAIIIALVPMTYVIDKRLPFLIGSFAYLMLFITGFLMREVERVAPTQQVKNYRIVRDMLGKSFVGFLVVYGLVSALQNTPTDYLNLSLKEFGLRPEYLGWLYAITSMFGALIGPFIKHFKKLTLPQYMVFDATLMAVQLIAVFTASLPIMGAIFILNFAFWRYRRIIYQDYLLNHHPAEYKATLLSLLNNASQVNELWLPLLFGGITSLVGLRLGLGYIGLAASILVPIAYFVALRLDISGNSTDKQV